LPASSSLDQIAQLCSDTLREVFKADEKGEIVLEGVRLIAQLVKRKSYNVRASVLDTFLDITFISGLDKYAKYLTFSLSLSLFLSSVICGE
jgi:hypothetical protein